MNKLDVRNAGKKIPEFLPESTSLDADDDLHTSRCDYGLRQFQLHNSLSLECKEAEKEATPMYPRLL